MQILVTWSEKSKEATKGSINQVAREQRPGVILNLPESLNWAGESHERRS